MEAVGLKTHIWNNNLRSAALLAGFPVLLLGMVYAITLGLIGAGMLPSTGSPGGDAALAWRMMAAGAPLAIGVAIVWFVIAYFANQTIIDLATGAREVTRADAPQIYNMLENLAISRGMKTPTLRMIDTDQLNAFASGLHEGQYSVTLTRGIVAALNSDELEAVIGHELTHIISRDVRTMVIASVFAGIITLLAQVVFRAVMWGSMGRRSSRNKGAGLFVLLAMAVAAIGYVLSIVIRMALSRSREFVADAGAVELTKNPDAMISALQKIDGHSRLEAPESLRGMFLDNHERGLDGLFATHPPIAKRIAALVKYAGGKVVEPAPVVAEPAATHRRANPWGKAGPWG